MADFVGALDMPHFSCSAANVFVLASAQGNVFYALQLERLHPDRNHVKRWADYLQRLGDD